MAKETVNSASDKMPGNDVSQIAFHEVSPSLAAECVGVNLTEELREEARSVIYDGFLKYQLLVFRNQALEKTDQLRFSRYFGKFELPINKDYLGRDFPELHVVSNLDGDGKPTATKALANPGNFFWHTDASYMRVPSSITLLYGVKMPSQGGDTSFANMYAAYEALPADMKEKIADLRAIHSWEQSRRNSGSRSATAEEKQKAPPIAHPLVRTHPDTGRKALYIGIHTSHIEGMDREEGRQLLADLLLHATQPQFVYTHQWKSGDLVMWDNRCLLHCASDKFDMENEPRVLHRTVLSGTVPA